MERRLLIDFGSALRLTLQESAERGRMVARGEFGQADTPTQNRRVYPRKLWEREIRNIQEAMRAGKVLGHLDHPADGKTSLSKVSHLITSLELLDDGQIIGEAKILDNEHGRQLRSILEAGGAIGVSSRGMGSTQANEDGSEMVADDYQYMTHDFVADPAVLTSYPKFTTEVRWIEPQKVLKETEMKVEKGTTKVEAKVEEKPAIPEATPIEQAVEQTTDKLKEIASTPAVDANAEANVKAEAVTEKKDGEEGPEPKEPPKEPEHKDNEKKESPEKEKGEKEPEKKEPEHKEKKEKAPEIDMEKAKELLKSDPEFAAALSVLIDLKPILMPFLTSDEIKKELKDRDDKIESLEKQVKAAMESSEKFAAALQVSRAVERSPELKSFLEGKEFAKPELVAEAVRAAKLELQRRVVESKKQRLRRAKMEARYEQQLKTVAEENAKLKTALDESVKNQREIAMRLYVEEKTRGHAQAEAIRKLCEGKDKAAVDSIVESHAPAQKNKEFEAIRNRLGKFSPSKLVEEHVQETGVSKTRKFVGVDQEIAGVCNLNEVDALR